MAQAQQAGHPNRDFPQKPKKNKFAHTQNTPYGMGDSYGTGVRAKLGKVREGIGLVKSKKKMGTPPKSLA